MAIQYSVTHRTNAMTQLASDIGENCVIKIFTGTAPSSCGDSNSGDLLVTFNGNISGFGTATNGVLTVNPISNAIATQSGTAGYFRIYPSSATSTNAVMQGSCGTASADMILTSTSITIGQAVQFTSMTVTAYGA
jgi:hypothetical protein